MLQIFVMQQVPSLKKSTDNLYISQGEKRYVQKEDDRPDCDNRRYFIVLYRI